MDAINNILTFKFIGKFLGRIEPKNKNGLILFRVILMLILIILIVFPVVMALQSPR